MAEVIAKLQEKVRVTTEIKGSEHPFTTDVGKSYGGCEEYASPSDLLSVSLASCMLTLMALHAHKKKIEIEGSTITVQTVMTTQHTFATFHFTITCPLPLTGEEAKILEKAALSCPVLQALDPDIKKEHDFQWKIHDAP